MSESTEYLGTTTVQDIIKRLGTPPVGMTSLIAAPEAVIEAAQPAAAPTREAVQKRLAELRHQQDTCGSDAAWWGYAGGISYLQALDNVLEAADLCGPTQMPSVPQPQYGGVLMDLMGQVEKYGKSVLEAAKLLAAARAAHPAEKIDTKQVELSMDDIRRWSKPIYDAVNAMQQAGLNEHVAMGILMYSAGAIAGQMRVVLNGTQPLQDAIPPLFQGWQRGREMLMAQQPGPRH